jgi:hypothetical protein
LTISLYYMQARFDDALLAINKVAGSISRLPMRKWVFFFWGLGQERAAGGGSEGGRRSTRGKEGVGGGGRAGRREEGRRREGGVDGDGKERMYEESEKAGRTRKGRGG